MKNFDFTKNRKTFLIIVAVVLVIGIASFIIRGFNIDIDFIGGTTIQLDMNRELSADDLDDIKATVAAMEVGDAPEKLYFSETVVDEVVDGTADEVVTVTSCLNGKLEFSSQHALQLSSDRLMKAHLS